MTPEPDPTLSPTARTGPSTGPQLGQPNPGPEGFPGELPFAPPPHMSPDEFRAMGHRLVDWAADYMAGVSDRSVTSATRPGDLLAKLPTHAPQQPGGVEEWDRIVADLDSLITPALTHWQHPGFFAYFPCNSSGPGVLGELVSAALDVNGMLWSTSPAVTELEMRMMDWFAGLFALPHGFRFGETTPKPAPLTREPMQGGGVIQGTASEGTLVAMLAARQRARVAGDDDLWVFTSDQAHSSVVKAAMIAGVANGPEDYSRMRLVRSDAEGRMTGESLVAEVIGALGDRETAPTGVFITASVGTTGVTAVDEVRAIAEGLDRAWRERWGVPFRGWLHVDAAFSGCAWVCEEHRWMMDGLEHADSVGINPHKWLLTNFDCNLFWTRDTESVRAAMSITPEYLRNAATDAGAVVDYRDWQVPLGRRFRALKLWFVARHYGAEGLKAHIRAGVGLARAVEHWARADERFEVVAPVTSSLVCFRLKPLPGEPLDATDARNRELLAKVNASGRVLLSHTGFRVGGQDHAAYILRMAIGTTSTRPEHVRDAWAIIRAAADELVPSP